MDQVKNLFQFMKKNRIPVDRKTYILLVKSFAEHNSVNDIISVLDDMASTQVWLDSTVIENVFQVCNFNFSFFKKIIFILTFSF